MKKPRAYSVTDTVEQIDVKLFYKLLFDLIEADMKSVVLKSEQKQETKQSTIDNNFKKYCFNEDEQCM